MANDLYAERGRRLREIRKQRGLSLRDITSEVGINKAFYCRIEAGEVGTSDEVRMRIAAALGVRVEDIFVYPDQRAAS